MTTAIQNKKQQNLIIAKGISDSEQLPVFTEQLNALRNKLEYFESNIPQNNEIGTFLKEISELMSRYNLSDRDIKPLQKVESNELICIPVNMECTGKLSEIFEFYRNLQSINRQIRILGVKLNNAGSFNGEIKMETDIVIYCKNQLG